MPKPTVELNLFSQQLWLQRPNFFGQRLGEKSAHKLAMGPFKYNVIKILTILEPKRPPCHQTLPINHYVIA